MAVFLSFASIEQIIKTYEGPKTHCTKGWLFEEQDSVDRRELCDALHIIHKQFSLVVKRVRQVVLSLVVMAIVKLSCAREVVQGSSTDCRFESSSLQVFK